MRSRTLVAALACLSVPAVSAQERRGLELGDARELAELQPAIDGAIDRGVAWLLEHQLRDGSWAYGEHDFAGGQTALSAYTLLKSGVPSEHAAIRRALERLRLRRPAMVYAAACKVMALRAAGHAEDRARIAETVDYLLRLQNGSWSYPNDDGAIGRLHRDRDLSITQFALLAMRAAQETGLPVPPRAWAAAADAVVRYQETPHTVAHPGRRYGRRDVAGFRYRWSRPGTSTGSMTTAGIAGLALCRDGLGGGFGGRGARDVRRAVELGLAWLDHHWTVSENPRKSDWLYYYLYGLERVGSLLGTEYVGSHPWYLEGARFLVGAQEEEGRWKERHAEPDTCFALLFLTRATAPATGRRTDPPATRIAEEGAVGLRAAGGADGSPLRAWITHVGRRPEDGGRGPAPVLVERVEYCIDGEPVAVLEGDATRPRRPGEAYAFQRRFERRGRRTLQAHVMVHEGGQQRVLSSDPLAVEIDHVLEPWMLDAATAFTRNELAGVPVAVEASSHDGGDLPRRAFDQRQSTAWVCDEGDAEPAITARLRRRVRAGVVVLSQAAGKRAALGELDRITRVEVVVNGRASVTAELADDELESTVVELPDSTGIRELEVRVLAREEGGERRGRCGFAEVALEKR